MDTFSEVHPTALVDGTLLKADRKSAGYTQASFSAACGSVSLGTVRRAEQGNRIIRSALRRMAAILVHPVERYILTDLLSEKISFYVSIEGAWTGFFIESDRGRAPYVAKEEITFKQDRGEVTGTMSVATPEETRGEIYDSARVYNNVIRGTTHVEGWEIPYGLGSIIVASSRSNNWLEGFVSWFDHDTDRVETSRSILVRSNSLNFEKYCEEATDIMNRDIPMFQLRKLMEAGYDIDEAYKMLLALSQS